MKKWTVMLIPHDRSSTRTLTMSSVHFGVVVGLVVALTFMTTFLFQRQRAIASNSERLYQINRALELRQASVEPAIPVVAESLTEEQEKEIEARIRAEYDASLNEINTKLAELYNMEAKARDITGIAPPQQQSAAEAKKEEEAAGDGKGGGSDPLGFFAYSGIDDRYRPQHVIYGMSRPSADLIIQEIKVRNASLGLLVTALEKREEEVKRVPSAWPLLAARGRITSGFGYRRDPFHSRVRYHSGTDIAAPIGTKVGATARGKIIYSGFDGSYGNLIKIDHGNGHQTWYAHLSKRTVKEGETVEKGDLIGHVGSTGRSTGPHLHYEVHINGKAVNAAKYLSE